MHWRGSGRGQQGRAQEERGLQEEQRRQQQPWEAGRAAALGKGRRLRMLFASEEGLVRPALTDGQLVVTLSAGEPEEQLVFAEKQGADGEPTSAQI